MSKKRGRQQTATIHAISNNHGDICNKQINKKLTSTQTASLVVVSSFIHHHH
jgi:hypothetical protein